MRYVLLLQGDKVSAFANGRTGFNAAVVFHNNSDGHEKFSRYLQERHDSLFSIVIDSQDEEHHQDSMPVLKGRDRKRYLRKISLRHFPNTPLTAASTDEKSKTGSKMCGVTASGLPESSDCEVWLDLLSKNAVLMTSISSLSLLGVAIHRLSNHRLSLSAVQVGQNDFRLIAYNDGRLIICRHLTISDSADEELINHLQQTQVYLEQLSIPGSDTSTIGSHTHNRLFSDNVRIIGALPAECRAKLEQAGITVFGCRKVSRMLGIKSDMTAPFADMLFAAIAVKTNPKPGRLAMGAYKNNYLSRRLRHVLWAIGIACCGVTAAATSAAIQHVGTYESLISTTGKMNSELVASGVVSETHLSSESPIDAIRDSMRVADQIRARTQLSPLHFLSSLASDLTVYPEIEVSSINWSHGGDEELLQRNSVDAEGRSGDLDSGTVGFYNATISGYLEIRPSERVTVLGRFKGFVSALSATGQYESVTVVEAPYNVSGGRTLGTTEVPSTRELFVIELLARKSVP